MKWASAFAFVGFSACVAGVVAYTVHHTGTPWPLLALLIIPMVTIRENTTTPDDTEEA